MEAFGYRGGRDGGGGKPGGRDAHTDATGARDHVHLDSSTLRYR